MTVVEFVPDSITLAETSGTGDKITLKLPKKQQINQIVVMEDIVKGERVGKFVLEGKTKKGWKTIFQGSSIGHKFIHRFDTTEISKIRMKISESIGDPQIKELSVFYVEK